MTVAQLESTRDWSACSLTELVEHIQRKHHAFLRSQLPYILRLLDALILRYNQDCDRWTRLRNIFVAFMDDMLEHLEKEERDVFPMCRQLDCNVVPEPQEMLKPLHAMMDEHDDGALAMEKMRELTNNFQASPTGDRNIRDLMEALAELDRDMHEHVRLENCVLALRAQQLAARLRRA